MIELISNLQQQLSNRLQRPIQRWISRKLPPANEVELGINNIMILPTRLGLALLVLASTIFLLAINYENSMGFALSFFLLSLWLLALHATFQNLSGLIIKQQNVGQAHVGKEVHYGFSFQDKQERGKFSIEAYWQEHNRTLFNLSGGQPCSQKVFCHAKQRGYLEPGRLQIVSYFPLMLFRAWSSVALSRHALIFPKPIAATMGHSTPADPMNEQPNSQQAGSENISGLRGYKLGDPLHHIAWKASAKRAEGLISKEFESPAEQKIWLDYEQMTGPGHEYKLSQLCYWCLELEQKNVFYGLKLPQQKLAPNRGAQHFLACLTLLAKQPKQEVQRETL